MSILSGLPYPRRQPHDRRIKGKERLELQYLIFDKLNKV